MGIVVILFHILSSRVSCLPKRIATLTPRRSSSLLDSTMQRTIQLKGAAIPFHKALNPAPILTGKAHAHADKGYRVAETACAVKFGRWAFGVSVPGKKTQVKLNTQAPRNALAIKGVSGSLSHHHHKSDIAKSNLAEYERSTKHALSRDFFAKKAPLADHPLHIRTADPIEAREFAERWHLDHTCRNLNDMARGPEKLQNFILAKKPAAVAEAKK